MRAPKYLYLATLCSMMLAISLTSSRAQTANTTWIGPATGSEWNTPADWDIGIPAEGTNALIGVGTNVNYNVPMAATTFGILSNNGVLNINAAGFNCTGIVMPNPSGGDRLFLNSGANVTVNGNVLMSTNSYATMNAGSSLTINGALDISYNTSSKAAGLSSFTNNGGALMVESTAINNNSGTENALLVINGGTNNLGTTVISRSSTSSFQSLGAEGLAIYGGIVTTTNLNVGNNGTGVSYLSAYIAGGTVTNQGSVFVNQGTVGRDSRLIQSGGLFVVPDPSVVNANSTVASTSICSVTGGTNFVGGFYLGSSNNTAAATVNVTNNAIIYVGSQGIASNGAVTINVSLGNGGIFGATAPWIGNANMKLPGGIFTFQAADMNGNPNSITLSNALSGAGGLNKTGGGTLTLDAANTYAGNTMINAGTLAVGGTGSLLDSLNILVGSGTTFDVSQDTGYTVGGSPAQTLEGFGTVNGAVSVASGGIVSPGSNTLTGTLTINGGLTETGGAVNLFQLSGNPSGPNNDFLNASGGLTVSGSNSIQINGSGLQAGGAYPLISYGSGGFNGSLADFTVVGATGFLSNSVTAQTIYLVVQATIRAATNLTWVGSSTNNNWDTETTSNWVDTGSANKDYFVPGDKVLFGNLGVTNIINVAGSPTPGSITVNTTTNYTITGLGAIDGTGTLTVSNGLLTILTTNIFNAPVILDGGILATPIIANSSSPSGIGESSASPGNLVFNGGTLAYTGGATSTDHGMTLTNGGGTIDVTNSSELTLNGNIVGNGTLTVVDSGTLALNNPNSYTNSTIIEGGVLQLDNANGAGSGTINFSNAALIYDPSAGITVPNAFNFDTGTTNMIVVTDGGGGNPISGGNWTGGGVLLISNTFSPYTVNGNLDGFTGRIVLDTPNQAEFRFNSGGGNTSTGSTNATFDLSNTNAELVCRNPGVIDLGALTGSLGAEVFGPTATAGVLIWSIGANNFSTTYGGLIANNAGNEASELAKVGTGTLTLVGGTETILNGLFPETLETNLLEYTGPTTISNGVLAIIVPDALSSSTNVTLASSSAVLDASQMGYVDPNSGDPVTNSVFEVVDGQTLSGIGTIRGTLVTDPGSTFDVGLPNSTGTLTVTNAVSLGGTTQIQISRGSAPNATELISDAAITNNGGALVVNNIGATLQPGDTFTLFDSTIGSYIGSFSSITLPALSGSESWNTNDLYINGTISVVAPTPLSFSSITTSGKNIVLSAVGGTPGGQVTILTSTNLQLPLSQWSTLTTGNFDSNGDFTYTVTGALNSGQPQQFYILQVAP
jgi:fibronectin-binding autotransporter adhesin